MSIEPQLLEGTANTDESWLLNKMKELNLYLKGFRYQERISRQVTGFNVTSNFVEFVNAQNKVVYKMRRQSNA